MLKWVSGHWTGKQIWVWQLNGTCPYWVEGGKEKKPNKTLTFSHARKTSFHVLKIKEGWDMFGNKVVAIKFTLQVYSVTAAWFLLWLYPSCCQNQKSYLHSLLNIQRAGISTWQMLLFTWRLDFTCTLIKFICRDRLNFLILKLLEFVNQVLLWSKQHVHEVTVVFRKIKDFVMERSQRAHLDPSCLSCELYLLFTTAL